MAKSCSTNRTEKEQVFFGKALTGSITYTTPKDLSVKIDEKIASMNKTESGRRLEKVNDGGYKWYHNEDKGLKFQRVTNFLKRFHGKNTFSESDNIRRYIRNYTIKEADDWKSLSKEKQQEKLDIRFSYYNENKDSKKDPLINYINQEIKRADGLLAASSINGTYIHESIEYYIAAREKFIKGREGEDNRKINSSEMATIIKESIKLNKNFNSSEESVSYKEMTNLLIGVEKEFSKIISLYNIVKIIPEQVLSNQFLGGKEGEASGIGGSADITFFTADGGTIVVDVKTKERKYSGDTVKPNYYWNKSNGSVPRYEGKGISKYHDNKYNDAGIQTSIYGLMYEAEGFEMIESRVLYIDSKMEVEYDDGEYSYTYSEPQVNETYSTVLTDFRDVLKPLLDEEGKVFNKTTRKKGEITDISSMISYLSDDTEITGYKTDKIAERRYKTAQSFPDANVYGVRTKKQIIGEDEYFVSYTKDSTKDGREISIPKDKINNEAYIKARIKEMADNDSNKDINVMNKFISYANGSLSLDDRMMKGAKGDIVKNLFNSLPKEYYTHKRIQDINGMSDVSDPIIVSTHRITGETILTYVSHGKERYSENIVDIGNGRGTIFGKMYHDRFVYSRTGIAQTAMRSSKENFKLLTASAAALRMKQLNPNLKISFIQKTTSMGRNTNIYAMNMDSAVEYMTVFRNAHKDKFIDAPVSGYMKDLLEDDKLFKKNYYKNDYVTSITGMLNHNTNGDVKSKIERLSGLTYDEYISELSEMIGDESYSNKGYYDPRVRERLMTIESSYIKVFSAHKIDVKDNPTYRAIVKAINYIDNYKEVTEKYHGLIASNITLQSNNQSHLMQHLSSVYQINEAKAKRRIAMSKTRLDKAKKALMKEYGYTNAHVLVKGSITEMWRDLMQNPDMDRENPEGMMRLKDVKDLKTQAQKDFVNLYNEILLESMESIMPPKVFKEEKNNLIGWIPKYTKTKLSAKNDKTYEKTKTRERYNKSLDKKTDEKNKSEANVFDPSVFEGRIKNLEGKWVRRNSDKGIDREGEMIDNWDSKDIETNLEYVLGNLQHDAIMESLHMQTMQSVRLALTAQIIDKTFSGGNEVVKDIRRQAVTFIEQTILGNTNAKGTADYIARETSKYATIGMLISFRQLVLDSSTVVFNGLSRSLSSKIESFMRKDRSQDMTQIDGGAHTKAMGLYIKNPKLFNAIGYEYGFAEPDSDSIKSRDSMKSVRGEFVGRVFKPNKFFLDTAKTAMFIAKMYTDGSLAAYSVNSDGVLEYNEKKDPRFYKNGKIENKLLLEAVKNEQEKEGLGLNEDGTLWRGYTAKEINVINQDIISYTGSFDKAGKTLVSNTWWGMALFKFRGFIIAKLGTYYREKSTTEEDYYGELKKVYDKDGNITGYEWTSYAREGIFQTLSSMMKRLKTGQAKMIAGELSPIEKKNLSRMMSDLAVGGILTAMIYGGIAALGDDDEDRWIVDSALSQSITKGLVNASADVLFALSLYQVFLSDDASLFAGFGASIRLIGNVFDLFENTLSGEFWTNDKGFIEDSKSYSGINRSIWEFEETFRWDHYSNIDNN